MATLISLALFPKKSEPLHRRGIPTKFDYISPSSKHLLTKESAVLPELDAVPREKYESMNLAAPADIVTGAVEFEVANGCPESLVSVGTSFIFTRFLFISFTDNTFNSARLPMEAIVSSAGLQSTSRCIISSPPSFGLCMPHPASEDDDTRASRMVPPSRFRHDHGHVLDVTFDIAFVVQ